MKSVHWNGEMWYLRDESIPRRIVKWFIWTGGWRHLGDWNILQRSRYVKGKPWWRRISSPTPLSLFGHRITIYGWGGQVRLRGRYLVWTNRRTGGNTRGYQVYISPDGTPMRAHTWLYGWPYQVDRAARLHAPMQDVENIPYAMWRQLRVQRQLQEAEVDRWQQENRQRRKNWQ